MGVKPTQSRGGVKGGSPLAESRGSASGGGGGPPPPPFLGRSTPRKPPTRRRQRSVPASNFARSQTRPQATLSITYAVSRQMGATDQHRENPFSRCWSFLLQGDFASAEATRGLCGRPLDCFACPSGCYLILIGSFLYYFQMRMRQDAPRIFRSG